MTPYWIIFDDGTTGCCDGSCPADARAIAEKVSGKKVAGQRVWGEDDPFVQRLPYPATPIIWQFDHPVNGRCPAFCYTPQQCAGRHSCPKNRACDD